MPYLLQQIPIIERNANLIQATEALINILLLAINSFFVYLFWLSGRKTYSHQLEMVELLEHVTPKNIRDMLGQCGQVDWIDRHVCSPRDLRIHGRIIITGRSRLGKTREAAELIQRAIEDDIVSENNVYQPGSIVRMLDNNRLRDAIRGKLNVQFPVLFFIDNLPHHFSVEHLDKLSSILIAMTECKETYVVAVARNDQLTDQHRNWLAQQRFYELELPNLNSKQTGHLIDAAAGLFKLQIDDDARSELVNRSSGTPVLPLMALRRLHADNIQHVDQRLAQKISHETISEAWSETRRYILEQVPAAQLILDALTVLHTSGVRTFKPLVIDLAMFYWWNAPRKKWPNIFGISEALDYLSRFDLVVQDDLIIYSDEMVESPLSSDETRAELSVFLEHSYLLKKIGLFLRKHSWKSVYYSSALLDLALGYHLQGDIAITIRLINIAIELNPHSILFNIRGIAHMAQGNVDAAMYDYDQSIIINPFNAMAYYNRGMARYGRGDLENAVIDFNVVIRIEPSSSLSALAYIGRGDVKKKLGRFEEAIRDYNFAMKLSPEDASTYMKRGNVLYDLGNYVEAIRDYNMSISLSKDISEKVKLHNLRGNALQAIGNLNDAITDFNMAIELDSSDYKAYGNRGIAYQARGDYTSADQDNKEALQLYTAKMPGYISSSLPLINQDREGLSKFNKLLKFILDLSFVPSYFIGIIPLFFVISLLIRLDSPGPIFVRRKILGLKGKQINLFKFRTMLKEVPDPYPDLQAQLQSNEKLFNDPRITRVGLFLRKFSLDELPGFFNLFLGHISLVGPRMISPDEANIYGSDLAILLSVKPGITGMWLISGRSDITNDERIRLDKYYIRNYSIFLDLRILLSTIISFIRRR